MSFRAGVALLAICVGLHAGWAPAAARAMVGFGFPAEEESDSRETPGEEHATLAVGSTPPRWMRLATFGGFYLLPLTTRSAAVVVTAANLMDRGEHCARNGVGCPLRC